MKLRYYLKDNNIVSRIYIDIRLQGKRSRIPTGYSVVFKNWDKKKQLVKSNDKKAFLLNTNLTKLNELIQTYVLKVGINNLTIKDIEDIVRNLNSTKIVSENVGDFIDLYLSKYINLNTKSAYLIYKKLIMRYNYELIFSEINLDTLNEFRTYLIDNNYSNSYIVRTLKFFKSIIREYSRQNQNYNINYISNFKIELSNNYSTLIALDEDEIIAIRDIELNERLSKIRDLFMVQCYTGLRVSDLLNIKPENVDIKRKEIGIATIKTSEIIRIPVTNSIFTIFEKYNFCLPKISDVKYNQYIKEVCKLAGIDAPTLVTSWRGGKRVDTIKPKYELISSHTARRTFITRLLRKGLLPEQIMKITGHRNRRSFDEYVKITQNEAVNAVRNALE